MSNILHSQDHDGVLTHVCDNLRRLRQAAGLSQNALAAASGISRRMIVSLESGKANISLSSLDKLAAVLGVDFIELVRAPALKTRQNINEIMWQGKCADSQATLLGAAPAKNEAQLWLWSLGAGERYDAEPDPEGWHEMLFITEGVLTLSLHGKMHDYQTGAFAIFSSAQVYSYINRGQEILRFTRTVLS